MDGAAAVCIKTAKRPSTVVDSVLEWVVLLHIDKSPDLN
jgi:hypothetical protein